jgi:hypothetical protein
MIRVIHPRSGSGFFTHPGSRGQKSTGSPDRDPQHCLNKSMSTGSVDSTLVVAIRIQILIFLPIPDPGSRALDPDTATLEIIPKKVASI